MIKLLEQQFYIGLDLGKMQDNTAIVLIQHILTKDDFEAKKESMNVTLIERVALGTPYQDIVKRVGRFFLDVKIKRNGIVVVDSTAAGEPVREMLVSAKLPTIGITIQGGHTVRDQGMGRWSVPRLDLLTTTRIAFDAGLIHISDKLELAEELLTEVENLKDRKSPIGKEDETLWREGESDDIAFALMCAVWHGVRTFPRISPVYEEAEPWREDEQRIHDYDPLGRK